ncbi:uncharacterized protein GGS25DRAFT_436790 [Hypoxylon fragiforme]|uniref:uncharacterized protein n=1 Tax=Hypoxylon fragiforme TaxID=63214 RepID=UPI0020C6790A|nr:uncharacterized protein GGS25DRAFT_436790 [Hypoxylon fragiforme]KAI2603825.1 hypothetical protein GGS25DRAFT_436790 [Hypoxylon fragiforme]
MSTTKTSRASSLAKSTGEIFTRKWPRMFFIIALLQAIVCLTFESYTFAQFQTGLRPRAEQNWGDYSDDAESQLKTIPVFLGLFILGFLYDVGLVWDALRMKNTIQIIGLCIAQLAFLVYSALQIDQIQEAIRILKGFDAFSDHDVWEEVKGVLIAIPGLIALVTIMMCFMAWKLYQEFAWDILKHIGADYRMKKRFLHYQIYIALLKFDFFFFVGFTIQFLVVVGGKSSMELRLTAAAVPITIIILICAAIFTRRESKIGMIIVMVLYLGGLSYFIYKLARIYDASQVQYYMPVRKSLTAFAVLTIILIILTIINAMVCMFNFGAGLKNHLNSARQEIDKDQASYSMNDVKQTQLPSRMTID